MKNYLYLLLFIVSPLCAQNIGIGTPSPNANAILDIEATDKGILIPRLTTAQRDAMGTVAAGMMIYNSTSNCFEFYNGTSWISLCATVAACSTPPASTPSSNSPVCTGATIALSATTVTGATYVWTGPNGYNSTGQNPTITGATAAQAGTYTLRTWLLGCYSDPRTVDVVVSATAPYRSCKEILDGGASTGDGVYTIDPDGAGALCPVQCYCDMTTDGGGWTLVLNYNHAASTNPATTPLTTSLPLLGSTTLGTNESGTAYWGHAAPSLMNALPGTTLRFYARTSLHARIIHFKSAAAAPLAYFRSGTGDCTGLGAGYTLLAGHTANLPASINTFYSNQGNDAMTNFPFYQAGAYHWGIRGLSGRWEADDFANSAGYNTLHQIWLR